MEEELQQAQTEIMRKQLKQTMGGTKKDFGELLHQQSSPLGRKNATMQIGDADDFKAMPIEELMAHEKGILNLLDQEEEVKKLTKIAQTISQDEYESIFHDNPTFYEKKAFVEMFRRKWREDKGFCSIFDKRQLYKQALQVKNKQ